MQVKQLGIFTIIYVIGAVQLAFALNSIRVGRVRYSKRTFYRVQNPKSFWFGIILFLAAAAFSVALPLWILTHR
jgi:hypothetical protein